MYICIVILNFMHKAGFVSILGYPNVGKSTLVNTIIGEQLMPVSPKAQTTRQRVLGIYNDDDTQIIFSDLPGWIIKPQHELHKSMLQDIKSAFDDSDILIFDEIYPFLNEWYNFVEKNPKITVEIRTKSVLWKKFIKYKSLDNLILSWSLAPSDIIVQYEKKTPSLEARLNAISQLLKRDWKINLALDPLIYTGKPWKIIYKEFLEYLVTKIDINLINSITVGVFRIPINYLRRMKSFSNSPISFFPYETVEGVASYPKDLKEEMLNYVVLFLERYFNRDKIYIK